MAIIKKASDKKRLIKRCGGKETSSAAVGMETGAATTENTMEIPQKIKNGDTIQFSSSIPG